MSTDAGANLEPLPVSDSPCEILRRSEAYRLNPDAAVPLDEAIERIERSLMGFPKSTAANALPDRSRA